MRNTEAEGVHEWVQRVDVEAYFAADSWNSHAVPITGNARNNTPHKMAVLGAVQAAETERVEERDRPGAHREHITEDATDSCGGTLIWLNEGRRLCDPS